jgi:hypothetical protein
LPDKNVLIAREDEEKDKEKVKDKGKDKDVHRMYPNERKNES